MLEHQTSRRDVGLDLMKGLVTILMIVGHVFQFYKINRPGLVVFGEYYINLTTFSAFMFCFGYACSLAYFSHKSLPRTRILGGGLKVLGAFYISAFGVDLIFFGKPFSTVLNIFWFSRISDYSEFLLSFAYLYALVWLWGGVFKKMVGNGYLVLLGVVCSLAFTYGPWDKIELMQLSPLVGRGRTAAFPIMQYLSYFLVGAFLAHRKIVFDIRVLALSLLGTLYFAHFVQTHHHLPQRFPPDIYWILAAYFPVCLYYGLAQKLARVKNIFTNFCALIGRHTLLCLVASNLGIFASRRWGLININQVSFPGAIGWYIFLSVVILGICHLLIKLRERWHHPERIFSPGALWPHLQLYLNQSLSGAWKLGQSVIRKLKRRKKMVGDTGLEPVTSAMSRQRSNQLS